MLTVESLSYWLDKALEEESLLGDRRLLTRRAQLGPFVIEDVTFFTIRNPRKIEEFEIIVRLPALRTFRLGLTESIFVSSGTQRIRVLDRVVSYLNGVDFRELLGLGEAIREILQDNDVGKPALERLEQDFL